MVQKYEIHEITSIKDPDYLPAIKIYIDVTPADVRTDTNEIAKSVDNPLSENGRKMFFFSLHYQRKIVGFAQFAFLPNMKIIFMDYMAIADEYKKNSIFYPFFSMLMLYFNDAGLDYNYFVTEIGAQNNDEFVDHDSAFLRKVLAMENFNIVDGPYFQPCLGYNKTESNINAHLYLKTSAPLNKLSKELFLKLLREILYEHYDSWYKIMLSSSEYEEYHQHIIDEYNRIESSITPKSEIALIDCVSNECKYYSPSCAAPHVSNINTAGYAPQSKSKRSKLPFALMAILATFCVSIFFYKLISYLKIPVNSFSAIYAATTSLAVGFTAYYFNHKN